MKIMICGKGGAGKSTISVLMAKALAKKYKTYLIDSDESNVLLPKLLGVKPPTPLIEYLGGKSSIFPKGEINIVKALEKAGEMFPDDPLNPDHLRAAFLALDLNDRNSIAAQLYPTGRIKFAPNGDNIYAGTAVLQVQLIKGKLTPVVVWPEAEPGIQPIFPRPDWPGLKG